MKDQTFRRGFIPCFLLLFTVGICLPFTAVSSEKHGRRMVVRGVAVTGFNEVCGEAVQALPFPAPLSPTFHGAFVGEYDTTPGATAAIPLTPSSCDNKNLLLATTTDDNYLNAFGFPDADSRLKNIPLRDVPTIVTLDGKRSAIPPQGVFPPNPFPPTKSEPNDQITLGNWLKARGKMKISCKKNGSASVRMRLKHLVPNALYSVLAITRTTPPGFNFETIAALPFGGVPNIFVTDEKGNAKFKRKLDSCPMDETPDGSQILFIDIGFHSDNNVYGAVPAPVLQTVEFFNPDGSTFFSVLGSGTVAHDHLDFFITGHSVEDE